MDEKISPQDKTLMELSSVVYDDAELIEIAQFNGAMNEFDTKYPVECLRKVGETYRVSYLGASCIATIYFNKEGIKMVGNVYRLAPSTVDFSTLTVGKTLEDVQTLDSEGAYPFLYTGRNDIPRVSTHCTTNGYFVFVMYDEQNTIINISQELI